ncbi:AMP-binding protein [Plantactinospora siamensis]|uniref:AMP-binding protein n=1 Tax=Plantactinospora siamensis TaxID=555372 RepID=A0ABV6P5A7_9ACTN
MNSNPLTSWIDVPAAYRGIRFWRNDGWESWSYPDLAAYARRIAGGIAAAGVRHDDRVLLIERAGPDFVAALYGIMLAGAVPCPVAPPHLFQNELQYARHLDAVSRAADPTLVITTAALAERLTYGGYETQVRTAAQLGAGDEGVPAAPASAALLQFTSGSSGRVKGVRVPVSALAANVSAIRSWLEMGEGDATASWLPVHHDMGLIGCLLTPVVQQRDLWLQEPADFVRDPARYLACFSRPGAAMTAMPPFGLDYIARRLSPQLLAGCDFSGWRALIIGAERIDVAVLDRFMALMGPFGFDRRALLPAYGLAEATLAVTGLALREEVATVPVAPQLLSLGEPVRSAGADVHAVVGCGRPLDGVSVTVVDEDGNPLPDRHVGQIVVRGASVAQGYVAANTTGLTEWRDGALWSGDAGFLDDGQLFVIGRLGDAMKVRGRTVFAEDLESALVEAGVPRLRVAVLLGATAAGATGVILLERPEQDWIAAAAAMAQRVTEGMSTVILDVPRRSIYRTTSGKPKRRDMWAAYVAGNIEGAGLLAAPVGGMGD